MPDALSAELKLVQQMSRSKYWRWVHSYLLDRLNALLDEDSADAHALARKEGSIREVRRLLRGPELVAAFLVTQRAKEAGGLADPVPPTPGTPDPAFWTTRLGGGDPLDA